MTAQKSVLQLSVHEEGIRKKAWVAVSRFSGVTSIEMDDKTGRMTVVGEVDVPRIVKKLRKICTAELVTVEVVKPPEKKPEPKKSEDFVAYPFSINYPYPYHSYHQPYCYCNCGGGTK
ncbi:heavy metal-associated isoprenylated plant protein 13 [Brassica napus]|nr:heavy metal-associated isoprenylated plant protein 13 [Brassica napus]